MATKGRDEVTAGLHPELVVVEGVDSGALAGPRTRFGPRFGRIAVVVTLGCLAIRFRANTASVFAPAETRAREA